MKTEGLFEQLSEGHQQQAKSLFAGACAGDGYIYSSDTGYCFDRDGNIICRRKPERKKYETVPCPGHEDFLKSRPVYICKSCNSVVEKCGHSFRFGNLYSHPLTEENMHCPARNRSRHLGGSLDGSEVELRFDFIEMCKKEKEDKISKWVPSTDLLLLRRMGKLCEELGELQAVASRIIIQGIDEVDPSSMEVNRKRLEKEIADVIAQCECTIEAFVLSGSFIADRVEHKKKLMQQWEEMFK